MRAFHAGLLSHRGPPEWHPARDFQKKVCADAAAYCESQGVNISTLAMAFTLVGIYPPQMVASAFRCASMTRQCEILFFYRSLHSVAQAILCLRSALCCLAPCIVHSASILRSLCCMKVVVCVLNVWFLGCVGIVCPHRAMKTFQLPW